MDLVSQMEGETIMEIKVLEQSKGKLKIEIVNQTHTLCNMLKEEFGDTINEGPAYEYSKFIKKIEKSRDSFGKDVLNFYELLRKKGLDDEAHDLLDDYKKYVIKFGLKFKKLVRKLL